MGPHHPFRSAEARERYLKLYDSRAKRWPIDSEERLVDTAYGQTFMRVGGPVDGDPLVLLHGLSATSVMWIPIIAALSEKYRTYALDTVGDAGRSLAVRQIARARDYMEWLDQVFDGLKLYSNINILGISYGGWLAAQYAVHAPGRLSRAVLMAPAATVLPLSFRFLTRIALNLTGRKLVLGSFFRWLFADLGKSDPSALEEFIEMKVIERHCLKPIAPIKPTCLTDAQLRGLRVPFLFIVGENEKIYSPEKAVRRLERVAPQIKTIVVRGAGHDLLVQSEAVSSAVLEFLTSGRAKA